MDSMRCPSPRVHLAGKLGNYPTQCRPPAKLKFLILNSPCRQPPLRRPLSSLFFLSPLPVNSGALLPGFSPPLTPNLQRELPPTRAGCPGNPPFRLHAFFTPPPPLNLAALDPSLVFFSQQVPFAYLSPSFSPSFTQKTIFPPVFSGPPTPSTLLFWKTTFSLHFSLRDFYSFSSSSEQVAQAPRNAPIFQTSIGAFCPRLNSFPSFGLRGLFHCGSSSRRFLSSFSLPAVSHSEPCAFFSSTTPPFCPAAPRMFCFPVWRPGPYFDNKPGKFRWRFFFPIFFFVVPLVVWIDFIVSFFCLFPVCSALVGAPKPPFLTVPLCPDFFSPLEEWALCLPPGPFPAPFSDCFPFFFLFCF